MKDISEFNNELKSYVQEQKDPYFRYDRSSTFDKAMRYMQFMKPGLIWYGQTNKELIELLLKVRR